MEKIRGEKTEGELPCSECVARKVKRRGQRRVLACFLHGTRGVDYMESESTWRKKERPIKLKEFLSKSLYFISKLEGMC